jgi:hypothetical protein
VLALVSAGGLYYNQAREHLQMTIHRRIYIMMTKIIRQKDMISFKCYGISQAQSILEFPEFQKHVVEDDCYCQVVKVDNPYVYYKLTKYNYYDICKQKQGKVFRAHKNNVTAVARNNELIYLKR